MDIERQGGLSGSIAPAGIERRWPPARICQCGDQSHLLAYRDVVGVRVRLRIFVTIKKSRVLNIHHHKKEGVPDIRDDKKEPVGYAIAYHKKEPGACSCTSIKRAGGRFVSCKKEPILIGVYLNSR